MKISSPVLGRFAPIGLVVALASLGVAQNREKFVISAKAGVVNSVIGRVMVTKIGQEARLLTAQDDLSAGDLVSTGAGSRAEVLLNPGSYFRVTENSEFSLTDNSLDSLQVRLMKGSAIVEAMGGDGTDLRITIITDQGRFVIVRSGVYRIRQQPGSTELLVRKGRVLVNNDPNPLKGGKKLAITNGASLVTKLTRGETDDFDIWSKKRAEILAKANQRFPARAFNSYLAGFSDRNWPFTSARWGLWVLNPRSGCFTFLPFYYGWSSPYGMDYSFGAFYYAGNYCCGGYPQTLPGVSSTPRGSSGGPVYTGPGPTNPGSSHPPTSGPRDPESGQRIPRKQDP